MDYIIAHLDMDAFFASIEERDRPYLRGKPIVVGADPRGGRGRGVVSTANYMAREYGIHSAMPISQAWRLSRETKEKGKAEVIFLSPDFEKYEKTSKSIFEILKKFSFLVEPASIDEFYFDLGDGKNFFEAKKISQEIKKEIKDKEKLTSSIGIGPNKLIAKIASSIKKPDGLTVIKPNEVQSFLDPLPLKKIPGIGPKTEEFFHQKGIKSVEDLKRFSKKELQEMLGKWGEDLYLKVRGIDDSPLIEEREIKSIGKQITFLKDTLSAPFIVEALGELTCDVFLEFKKSKFKTFTPFRNQFLTGFKKITVTVRFANFETKTHSKTFNETTSSKKKLELEALNLLLPFLDKRKNPKRRLIRLIGVRIGGLEMTDD